ncbi:hypothetical protein EW093_16060 [Thiospirochaeta perfilievii]|uniref:HEPN domain-containing protein n=1 Tax=Thiospirochaeta perfilievii TaxID=252967 RepID=A0A5C1QFE7_9SPIO|nr:hypothetical protein [Thiospirochaeta perfilievii]QEN06137.1 hypothetical protein EW093_16060 [Thiospirochaeta perfilievii]
MEEGKDYYPQESYKNTLDRYLEIQNSIETLTTSQFSLQVSYIFKSYLSTLYSVDFLSSTNQEMLIKLERNFSFNNGDLVNFFLNELEPGQFGKYQIPKDKKNQIIKTCVDVITELYNKETGVEND